MGQLLSSPAIHILMIKLLQQPGYLSDSDVQSSQRTMNA